MSDDHDPIDLPTGGAEIGGTDMPEEKEINNVPVEEDNVVSMDPGQYETLTAMISELENQNSITASNISSITQKSGIMLALLSVAFIETVKVYDSEPLWWWAIVCFLISMFASLGIILYAIRIPTGSDMEEIGEYYDAGMFDSTLYLMYNDKMDSVDESLMIIRILTWPLRIQGISLIAGLLLLLIRVVA